MPAHREWVIPDGFLAGDEGGDLSSHEAVCLLNTGKTDAAVVITAYFTDREPLGPFKVACPAQRTNHVRIDRLEGPDGQRIPVGEPYAMAVSSDQPIVVQYSRMDSRAAALALMTTMAFPNDGA